MVKRVRTLKEILLAAIGKAWMYWPPRLAVKKRCKDPTRAGWFICEQCHQSREKIEVDHIIPCIKPSEGFTTWDAYISSRFVESEIQLQGLCRDCHADKTKKENKKRREVKKQAE